MKKTNALLICALFSMIFAACGGDHSNNSSPGNPEVDRNPSTAETPTPTPEPSTTPNPSATPVSTPVSTPAPTPNPTPVPPTNAQNLSESIQDVRWVDNQNGTNLFVTYYDLDHLGNPATALKTVQFNVRFNLPMPPYIRYPLAGNDATFNGSTLECSGGCATGAVQIVRNGASGSRLNGSVTIPFFRKQLRSVIRSNNGSGSAGSAESLVIRSLDRANLLGGSVTAFTVLKGSVQPFWVEMVFSPNRNSRYVSEIVSFRGNQISQDTEVVLQHQNIQHAPTVQITRAKTISDGNGYVDVCFKNTSALKRIGAYTWQGAVANGICD
jgi:hypothetical protein